MIDQRSKAIVLNITAHGESDKIVTLYSNELGKITAIAKGAFRSKKRFVNKLEIFTSLQIMYRPPGSGTLFFLSQAKLLKPRLSLRTSYPRFVAATYINELIQRFNIDNDPDPDLFLLLDWALDSVNTDTPLKTVTLFLLRLLDICGYKPLLRQCHSCGRTPQQNTKFTLIPSSGSIICNYCRKIRQNTPLTIYSKTLNFLNHGQQTELSRLDRLNLPPAACFQVINTLHHYSLHLLQQDIRSWNQLKNIAG
jgi:DNA repair protein RecO (recombination protein O)